MLSILFGFACGVAVGKIGYTRLLTYLKTYLYDHRS